MVGPPPHPRLVRGIGQGAALQDQLPGFSVPQHRVQHLVRTLDVRQHLVQRPPQQRLGGQAVHHGHVRADVQIAQVGVEQGDPRPGPVEDLPQQPVLAHQPVHTGRITRQGGDDHLVRVLAEQRTRAGTLSPHHGTSISRSAPPMWSQHSKRAGQGGIASL